MLFSLFTSAPVEPDPVATNAAVKCLLAYTHGLEDCQIDVETVDGVIMLTGTASSEDAARIATSIASDFASKPVISGLQLAAASKLT